MALRYSIDFLSHVIDTLRHYISNLNRESMILGFCNPLLDISASVDQEFLKKYDLKANSAILGEETHLKM